MVAASIERECACEIPFDIGGKRAGVKPLAPPGERAYVSKTLRRLVFGVTLLSDGVDGVPRCDLD